MFADLPENIDNHQNIVKRRRLVAEIAAGVTVSTGKKTLPASFRPRYSGFHAIRQWYASNRLRHTSVQVRFDTYGNLSLSLYAEGELPDAEKALFSIDVKRI
ncbi:hypothetical protein [Brucella sp. NBRC 12950]|uniref:hypothetical protein n=1 Tax=Brucella sp. NBRC 12950 TaxID=2994518 RepID=UPI0025530279|nr:hypothetical protein [Brucella sp. NBRC 12950]